ncbi:hypothetical protein OsJ_05796 [Oryza sativa Japonica Group]|uniref:NAF domain-containing protein n=1 Tax=Oryza sativa subsp. japonica TaxID=39947 RepID=A3A495_ORYSJ|nr:hypothetical protein OsJ_05796 [Oryza sativa Japonica Group]
MPPEVCTWFHLISLSECFDLSPLFEHDPAASSGRATARAGGTWFATREAASGVVARLEALATGGAMPTRVTRSSARGVRLAVATDRRLQRGAVVARGGRQEGWRRRHGVPIVLQRRALAGAQGHRLVAGGDLTTRRDVAAAIIARHRIVSVAIHRGALLFGAELAILFDACVVLAKLFVRLRTFGADRWIAHMTAQKRFAIAKGQAGDLQKPEEKNNTVTHLEHSILLWSGLLWKQNVV